MSNQWGTLTESARASEQPLEATKIRAIYQGLETLTEEACSSMPVGAVAGGQLSLPAGQSPQHNLDQGRGPHLGEGIP